MTRQLLILAAAVTLTACGEGVIETTEEMTYEEFLSKVHQEEDGVFVTDGDVAFETEEALRSFYEENFGPNRLIRVAQQELAVYRLSGKDIKYDSTRAMNITYCVSTKFGSRYSTVVSAMASAAGAWEAVARVNFVHLSQYDSSCTKSNSNVWFDVNPVNSGQYLARAFFPNSSRSSRNVLIDGTAFGNTKPSLTGVLRHELGHTLGFRHEHTRPEARACFEDSNWRALTSYDPYSVMHYPQCNGKGDWSLTLTSLDKSGAGALYPR